MKFRITLRNQISALGGLTSFTIIVIIAVWLLGVNDGFDPELFIFFAIFYLANLISVLFIHFQYYNANKGTVFSIEIDKAQFIFNINNTIKTISFSEIQEVDIYMLPSVYRGSNFQLLPFEQYHCAIIYTQNEKLIITSLVVRNIVKEFNNLGIKIIKRKCFYPYIR